MSTFSMSATWSGGLRGAGRLTGPAIALEHSAPSAFGGAGVGTNPEELALAAAASCYLITLSAILDRREIAVERIELASEVEVDPPPAIRLVAIVHRPRIFLRAGSDAAKAREAAHIAEKACMIAQAMGAKVTFRVEPELIADPAKPGGG